MAPNRKSRAAAINPEAAVVAAPSKTDAMTLLFRREVSNMFAAAPPGLDLAEDVEVNIIASAERLASTGFQESVQLCEAGAVRWVTRTEGGRQYFPRIGRVQKRVRDVEEDDEAIPAGIEVNAMNADANAAAAREDAQPVRKNRKGAEGQKKNAATVTPPAKPTRQPKKKSVDETPIAPRKVASIPSAPKKKGLNAGKVLKGMGGLGETEEEMRKRVVEALAREEFAGALGGGGDDLASLCGKVDGLDFKSVLDESEYGGHPVASTSKEMLA